MANAINSVTHIPPTETSTASAKVPSSETAQAKVQAPSNPAAVPKDTVAISNAAQTALQEAQETQAQTIKEASSGDRQAQRLVAKENAAHTTKA